MERCGILKHDINKSTFMYNSAMRNENKNLGNVGEVEFVV